MLLNILSACKAEERGVALATASDDNTADGKIGSERRPNCQVASTLDAIANEYTYYTK